MNGKYCTECGEWKPLTEFRKKRSTEDTLRSQCNSCANAYNHRYRKEHYESKLETERCWREENREKTRVSSRRWREAHPEYIRNWREEHPEYNHNYYVEHREYFQKYSKQYREEHREELRVNYQRWRARLAAAEGAHTWEEFEFLCKLNNQRCWCCDKKLPLTEDHIIPLSCGGSNNIDNIQPLCGSCNSSKGAKTIYYKTELRGDLL